jgi:hypothetical protein
MFLLVLIKLGLILQETIQPPFAGDNWFQYGLAGALIILMGLLLKYIIQRESHDKAREDNLSKQRSDMYREDNKMRDERWIKSLEGVNKTLERTEKEGDKFITALNNIVMAGSKNYNDAVEKFIQLFNKVMEQSSFQTQTLVELKIIVSKLPSEFNSLKNDINARLENLTLNYNLEKKDAQK